MLDRVPSSERVSQVEVVRLWERYRESGDVRVRDRLVLTFAPLVKYLAYGRVRSLPAHVGVEELISSGLETLIRCLDRYDPAKGASLEQFLWTRISGGMVDELRRQDWAPRSLRTTERDLGRARRDFRARHRREASDAEVSAAVGISEAKLRSHEQDVHAMSSIGSLNVLVSDDERGSYERGDLLVAADGDPQAAAFEQVDSDELTAALALLSTRERTVIGLLYFEELTLVEAGQILGVSESRVCQINRQAKQHLHHHLADSTLALTA
jgi:RNA polymerase sigma factor for flagellar operon FliA